MVHNFPPNREWYKKIIGRNSSCASMAQDMNKIGVGSKPPKPVDNFLVHSSRWCCRCFRYFSVFLFLFLIFKHPFCYIVSCAFSVRMCFVDHICERMVVVGCDATKIDSDCECCEWCERRCWLFVQVFEVSIIYLRNVLRWWNSFAGIHFDYTR